MRVYTRFQPPFPTPERRATNTRNSSSRASAVDNTVDTILSFADDSLLTLSNYRRLYHPEPQLTIRIHPGSCVFSLPVVCNGRLLLCLVCESHSNVVLTFPFECICSRRHATQYKAHCRSMTECQKNRSQQVGHPRGLI